MGFSRLGTPGCSPPWRVLQLDNHMSHIRLLSSQKSGRRNRSVQAFTLKMAAETSLTFAQPLHVTAQISQSNLTCLQSLRQCFLAKMFCVDTVLSAKTSVKIVKLRAFGSGLRKAQPSFEVPDGSVGLVLTLYGTPSAHTGAPNGRS